MPLAVYNFTGVSFLRLIILKGMMEILELVSMMNAILIALIFICISGNGEHKGQTEFALVVF